MYSTASTSLASGPEPQNILKFTTLRHGEFSRYLRRTAEARSGLAAFRFDPGTYAGGQRYAATWTGGQYEFVGSPAIDHADAFESRAERLWAEWG